MDARQGAILYQAKQEKLRKAKACITDEVLSIVDLGEENSMFRNADYYALRNLRSVDTDSAYFKHSAATLQDNPFVDLKIKEALKKAVKYLN